MLRKLGCALLALVLLAGAGVGGAYWWMIAGIKPMPSGKESLYRVERPKLMSVVIDELGAKGIVRNPRALRYYARWKKASTDVREGTYRIKPGLTADALFTTLKKPIRQMVRLPEGGQAMDFAKIIGSANVGDPDEYLALATNGEQVREAVSLPLPKGSLQGYLYPDTYDLPPLLGARGALERQLKNLENRLEPILTDPSKLHRAIIIGSMVELEAKRPEEKPIIAGVIENRLRIGMRLQIDATVLYGMNEWRTLTYADYEHDSPYNTYKFAGLPPGPICSPTITSIAAALKPAQHEFLYYVALANGSHLFARTYGEHLRNIRVRNQERRNQ